MRQPERGATVVEYALIVAVLCIVLIAVVHVFQDGAEARYDERATQGHPSEEFGNLGPSGGGTGGTDGSDDGGDDGGDPGVTSVVVQGLSASAPVSGSNWSMTVTVQVLGDGQPLGGVTIAASTWNPSSGGQTTPCTTSATGICTYTQGPMNRTGGSAVNNATFTVGAASFTNPGGGAATVSYAGSTSITCQKPASGSSPGTCA